MDRGFSRYTCTVVTDGRLRREVTSIFNGNSAAKTEVFEDSASEADVLRALALVNAPEFVAAAGNLSPKPGEIVGTRTDLRFVTVIVDQGKKRQIVNAIADGQGRTPAGVKELLSFADDVKKRKLKKLSGGVDLMCVIPLKDALNVRTAGQ